MSFQTSFWIFPQGHSADTGSIHRRTSPDDLQCIAEGGEVVDRSVWNKDAKIQLSNIEYFFSSFIEIMIM